MKLRRILRWVPSVALLLPGMAFFILAIIGNGDITKLIKEYHANQRALAISQVPIPMRPGFIPRTIEPPGESSKASAAAK